MRLSQLPADLGISEAQSQKECAHYQEIVFGRSQSRRTLGILNEIAMDDQVYAERHPLAEVAHLSAAQLNMGGGIYGAPNYIQPDKATAELLAGQLGFRR